MHVVIDGRVIRDHFPGIGRYAYHLIEALARQAPADHFTVLHNPGQRDSRYDLSDLAHRPAVRLCPVDAGVFSPAAQWQVRHAIRSARADVFHATYWVTTYWPGAPTALSVYDLIGLRQAQAVPVLRRVALGAALRLALRAADHVLTLSRASQEDLLAATGRQPEDITVTPLGVDARFSPADETALSEVRARYGLPDRYALYVGTNKPHKNLGVLVEAWRHLAGRHAPVTSVPEEHSVSLVLAGPWDRRYDEPRRLAGRLPPEARVRFLGPVPEGDLPALYGGAAVFAFPSHYEGFGLPPLEAMACGTPVVAADATSLPEVIGDAGMLVDPDDAAAWAKALARVLAEPELAADMRRRGLAQASRFSWDATARRTLAVYRTLVPDPGE